VQDHVPPAARRRAAPALTRERILDAAVEAFAQEGYEGSSLARVADAVGLSQPGLLHHFPSKRALLLAVLERRDVLDADRFSVAQVRGLDALGLLADLVDHNATVPGIVQTFSVLAGESAARRHPARGHFSQRYVRIRAELAAALRRGVEDGDVRPDLDGDAIAAEVFAVMDGLQLQWLHDPQAVDMGRVFRDYVSRLRQSLAR
jgi:AcrR family transcriptional regulator